MKTIISLRMDDELLGVIKTIAVIEKRSVTDIIQDHLYLSLKKSKYSAIMTYSRKIPKKGELKNDKNNDRCGT